MEQQKPHQNQNSVAIKEEKTDGSNGFVKDSATLQRNKTLVKGCIVKEANNEGIATDSTTKIESTSSPPVNSNFRNVPSPKSNAVVSSASNLSAVTGSTALKVSPNTNNSSLEGLNVINKNGVTSEFEHSITTSKTSTKVKRLLSTLLQFANSLNSDIGELVKTLILNLVCNSISIEEFHNSLQDATNFPLRPFVMPFLRNNVPILQKEIAVQAKLLKQNILQYVRQHENCVFDTFSISSELSEIFNQTDSVSSINQTEFVSSSVAVKRRYECHENNIAHKADSPQDSQIQTPPPAKKSMSLSSSALHTNGLGLHNITNSQQQPAYYSSDYIQASPPPFLSSGNNWLPTTVPLSSRDSNTSLEERKNAGESEWNNIHVMLNCILSMVEKTKRALNILQERNIRENHNNSDTENINSNINGDYHPINRRSTAIEDIKKTANELIAFTIRFTEERVAFVKKKAEEAVNEIKKQAITELQKAIAVCEGKSDLNSSGSTLNKFSLNELKKQFAVNSEQDYTGYNGLSEKLADIMPSQTNNCWNCGRKAQETCSGCNVARYCGSFCQHKDWESHHQICNTYINNLSVSSSEKLPTSKSTFVDSFMNRTGLYDSVTKSSSASEINTCRSQAITAEFHKTSPFSISSSIANARTTNAKPLTPLITTTIVNNPLPCAKIIRNK